MTTRLVVELGYKNYPVSGIFEMSMEVKRQDEVLMRQNAAQANMSLSGRSDVRDLRSDARPELADRYIYIRGHHKPSNSVVATRQFPPSRYGHAYFNLAMTLVHQCNSGDLSGVVVNNGIKDEQIAPS